MAAGADTGVGVTDGEADGGVAAAGATAALPKMMICKSVLSTDIAGLSLHAPRTGCPAGPVHKAYKIDDGENGHTQQEQSLGEQHGAEVRHTKGGGGGCAGLQGQLDKQLKCLTFKVFFFIICYRLRALKTFYFFL